MNFKCTLEKEGKEEEGRYQESNFIWQEHTTWRKERYRVTSGKHKIPVMVWGNILPRLTSDPILDWTWVLICEDKMLKLEYTCILFQIKSIAQLVK